MGARVRLGLLRLARVVADHRQIEIPVPEDDVAACVLRTGCDEEVSGPASVPTGLGVGELALHDQRSLDRSLAHREPRERSPDRVEIRVV